MMLLACLKFVTNLEKCDPSCPALHEYLFVRGSCPCGRHRIWHSALVSIMEQVLSGLNTFERLIYCHLTLDLQTLMIIAPPPEITSPEPARATLSRNMRCSRLTAVSYQVHICKKEMCVFKIIFRRCFLPPVFGDDVFVSMPKIGHGEFLQIVRCGRSTVHRL